MPEPEVILQRGTCCECKYNKCNRDRESRLPDLLFWIALMGAIYLYGCYIVPGLGGNDHAVDR